MTEDNMIGHWHQKDAARRAKYPNGNYPPLERWDLQLTIAERIRKATLKATRVARQAR